MSEPGLTDAKRSRTAGDILRFDEGDALLARRTDVKDSSDRYANTDAPKALAPPSQDVTKKTSTKRP